jgi:PAS domain S-box-containing protein
VDAERRLCETGARQKSVDAGIEATGGGMAGTRRSSQQKGGGHEGRRPRRAEAEGATRGLREKGTTGTHDEAEPAALALAHSEARYRALFTFMTEGCGVHEIITDADGRPCDYKFLDVNPAFERLTGLKRDDLLGRRVMEVLPGLEGSWVERFGRVALTGEPAHFESFAVALARWYDVFAYRTGPRQFAAIFTDVSERKTREAELRESKLDLSRAQEVGQMGSWRLDVRRNVLTWSDEAHRIFGVPTGTALTYETFLGIVHPADVELVDATWKAALRGMSYDLEHRIVVDGNVKWVRERAYLEFDTADNVRGAFGITQDITHRKCAEDQIASLARFPEENPNPVLRVRGDGIVVQHNPAAQPLLAAHRSGIDLPAPAPWQEWVREALASHHRRTAETRHRRRTFSFDVVPFPDAGYANLYGQDISLQTRTMAALRKARAELEARVAARTNELSASTALLEGMFDNTHVHLAHLDENLRFLRVNRDYAAASGRKPASFVGKDHLSVHGHKESTAILRRVLETGQPYAAYASPSVHAARRGTSHWDWLVQAVKGPEGEVVGVLVSLIDATDRVRLQREIVMIEERERHAIGRELHDTLGQQLSAIGYMLDNLETEIAEDGLHQPKRVHELRSAVSEADAQVRSISRGLHPAMLASGGLPAALGDLANQIETRCRITCSCDCPASVPLEPEAVTQLHRIAQEAVNNALKHARPNLIDIRLRTKAGQVTLSVHDDGVGITDLPRTTGLGLHIMAFRANAVGGTLSVRSLREGGTVVTCTVPASPARKGTRKA